MKTILQLSSQYGIPVSKLRRLCAGEKIPVLESKPGELEYITKILKRGGSLSVPQLVALISEPLKLASLEPYRKRSAQTQIRALGEFQVDLEPFENALQNTIVDAASKDSIAAERFAQWLSVRIPDEGCGYAYLAVRAALSCAENFRPFVLPMLPRAIMHARKSPSLAGMSETDENGKTQFFRKNAKNDLTFDL